MSTLVLGGAVRGGEIGGRPSLWAASFALVAMLHAAGGFALLARDEAPLANEAPEAAIMIDLPAELALPPAESVMSIASETAAEVPPSDAPSETVEQVTPAETVETVAEEAPPEPVEATEPPPEEAVEPPPDAVEPPPPETVEPPPIEEVTAEPMPTEVIETPPAEVALETPPEVEIAEEVVAPPVLPTAKPRPPREPVRQTAQKRPERTERPKAPARTESRAPPPAPAAVAGRQASGAGQPDASALRRYMSAMRADIMRQRRSVRGAASRRVTATVQFVVAPSGAVSSVAIVRSSGDSAADAAVADMVRRASPLPPMPPAVGTSPRRVSIPIRFE